MDLSRWQEIKNLVLEALDLPEEERNSYLDAICSNEADLRQEVEALLAVSSTRANLFDDFQLVPQSLQTVTFTEGEVVGSYRIVRPIGKGGMGAVYLAEDIKHDRHVALKAMPRTTKRLLQEEKRLLAKLQHPNIATLYDSGQTKSGFGYFIMEYVEGEPITDYCERHGLSLRERLELFLLVCDAVAVAHRNLIVHRDIKPSNILVTKEGVAKLLDFGIAKLLPSDHSLQPEAISFTEAFASPEQLRGEQTTTATDVYSLGVLLCLLLTGRLPYPIKRYEDLPWAIRNMEPEKPSDIILKEGIGLGADARPAPAANGNARKHSRRLHGDLDAIVLRTLRKDVNERYHSVQEIAADLQRFLNHEPVSIRAKSKPYRVRKFFRRHRLAVIISSSIVVASACVSIWLFVLFREAQYQRNQARRQQERSEAIMDFMVRSFELSNPFTPKPSNATVRDLLDKASLEAHSTLAHQPDVQVSVLALLGYIYNNLGLLDNARRLAQSAVDRGRSSLPETSPALADAFYSLGSIETTAGNYSKAEDLFRKSLFIRQEALGITHRDYATCMYSLGTVLFYQGKTKEAENLYRKALDFQRRYDRRRDTLVNSMTALALLLENSQRYDEAERLYREALAIARRDFGPNNPSVANMLDLLAQLLTNTRRFKEAEAMHREALTITQRALGNNHPDIIPRLYNFSFLLWFEGKYDESEKIARQALERSRQILGDNHESSLEIGMNLARFLSRQNKHAEALRLILDVESRARATQGEHHPLVISAKRQRAYILFQAGETDSAEEQIRTVIRLFERTPTADPLEREVSKSLLADCLVVRGKFEEAERLAIGWYKLAPPREIPVALQKLVHLYSQWGKQEKAAEYRRLLAEATSKAEAR